MSLYNVFVVENGTEQDSKRRRGCKYVSDMDNLKCETHDFGINGAVLIVEECLCDTEQCNRELPYIPTSTVETTTDKGIQDMVFLFEIKHDVI